MKKLPGEVPVFEDNKGRLMQHEIDEGGEDGEGRRVWAGSANHLTQISL
jgi:hypothetical protein